MMLGKQIIDVVNRKLRWYNYSRSFFVIWLQSKFRKSNVIIDVTHFANDYFPFNNFCKKCLFNSIHIVKSIMKYLIGI